MDQLESNDRADAAQEAPSQSTEPVVGRYRKTGVSQQSLQKKQGLPCKYKPSSQKDMPVAAVSGNNYKRY